MALDVVEAPFQGWNQDRAPTDVAVDQDLRPTGIAILSFRIELIKGIPEAFPNDRWRVARSEIDLHVVVLGVGLRQHDNGSPAWNLAHKWNVVTGVVPAPDFSRV